ncbi:ammonium transporter, putative [Ixodes scapularis]|uniref:Ammonium transporter, putative n=1 Tax=Ixodes scapularis TaxID=6945 RepID=B7Q9V7_IXOSC|nr:ammonium transporter, putative [Ixodes scapularis]|eukprot:XP_002406379.1 ammonium transporter, putative [Ixodes scapularis]
MDPRIKVPFVLVLVETTLVVLFGVCVRFDTSLQPKYLRLSEDRESRVFNEYYPMFEDVHVMVYVGFGYLMTFLKRYGYGAVGYTLLLSAIVLQWAVLMRGIWHVRQAKVLLDVESLLGAEFSVVTFLISFGVVLGKTSVVQSTVMALVETAIGASNEYLGVEVFQAVDPGGSIFLHTFGAYFGLAVALVIHQKDFVDHRNEGSVYTSDIFAMIGTLFLWLFWPSFNGASVHGAERHRAVVNTYLALTASCVAAFAVSSSVDDHGKFGMVHVQNSTLAGGVAIGTTANIMANPHSAIIVGSVAGVISALGYKYITPFLARRWKIHDTCGVNNLHGMPGLLAGLISIIVAAVVSTDTHGESLYLIYPARVPQANSTEFLAFNTSVAFQPGAGRSSGDQAVFQLWALLSTVTIAISGGIATGHFDDLRFLLRLSCFDPVEVHGFFDDTLAWDVAGPELPIFVEVKPRRQSPQRRPLRFKTRVRAIMQNSRTQH